MSADLLLELRRVLGKAPAIAAPPRCACGRDVAITTTKRCAYCLADEDDADEAWNDLGIELQRMGGES